MAPSFFLLVAPVTVGPFLATGGATILIPDVAPFAAVCFAAAADAPEMERADARRAGRS